MTPEHIKANLDRWVKDEAFHTIAGGCGDLIREIERLRAILVKIRDTAVTSIDDDRIWMDKRTTLEGFIDSEINN